MISEWMDQNLRIDSFCCDCRFWAWWEAQQEICADDGKLSHHRLQHKPDESSTSTRHQSSCTKRITAQRQRSCSIEREKSFTVLSSHTQTPEEREHIIMDPARNICQMANVEAALEHRRTAAAAVFTDAALYVMFTAASSLRNHRQMDVGGFSWPNNNHSDPIRGEVCLELLTDGWWNELDMKWVYCAAWTEATQTAQSHWLIRAGDSDVFVWRWKPLFQTAAVTFSKAPRCLSRGESFTQQWGCKFTDSDSALAQ